MPDVHEYVTEDRATVRTGERAYNYYDMRPGMIGEDANQDGWFYFLHDDGSRCLLNGQRICTPAFARGRGFKDAERTGPTEAQARDMYPHLRLERAVTVELPFSEVLVHIRVAGETRPVLPLDGGMAWVLSEDGSTYSAPVTRGEAGLR